MSKEETPSISIDDFMSLEEAVAKDSKSYTDDEYLAELSSKEARNAAFVAQNLNVTPATVVRRLMKLEDQILVKYADTEPFFVRKPTKSKKTKKKASKGVDL
jgi:predicted ArsR family transcriptional regulator